MLALPLHDLPEGRRELLVRVRLSEQGREPGEGSQSGAAAAGGHTDRLARSCCQGSPEILPSWAE